MAAIIMAWSKVSIKIGKTGVNDAMGTTLTSIGTIKDRSSNLESSDGDELRALATGGETVARERLEGGFLLTTRVIEPTNELLTLLELGTTGTGEFQVKTHIPAGDWSVEVTPKNVGAEGIKAPKTNITFKPGWSEEEGNYADLEFEILKGQAGYWYSKFVTTAPAG